MNVLKNSVRKITIWRSVMWVVFTNEISQLKLPGPRIMPTPPSPYIVGTPYGPAAREFGAFGAVQFTAAVLKKPGPPAIPPKRDPTPPGVAIEPYVDPGHICTRAVS